MRAALPFVCVYIYIYLPFHLKDTHVLFNVFIFNKEKNARNGERAQR